MSNHDHILHAVARRLKLFRETTRLSLVQLYHLIGLSNATLSRMERAIGSHHSKNVEILAEAFGVPELDFRNENTPVPSRDELIKSLKAYAKKHDREVNLEKYLQKSNTAYFLDSYLNEGNLDTYQTIKEIRMGIKNEFEVELRGPDLSNLMKKRVEQGIVEVINGEKKNTFKYKRKVTG